MTTILAEAWAMARAQRASSALTVLLMAGMVIALTLTSGRTVAAEQEVLRSIDNVGTRAIVVRAEPQAGLTTTILDRLGTVEGVGWMGAFSPIVEGRNAALPGAANVPVRYLYSPHPEFVGIPQHAVAHTAYASSAGLAALRMPYGVGAIRMSSGETIGAAPAVASAPLLDDFEPLVLVPATADEPAPVSVVVVLADTPDLVAPLTAAVSSLLQVQDPSRVTVTTSRELAELRALVGSQLSAMSRTLILGLVGVTAGLTAILQTALVLMRRRDYGRRRALGASRAFLIILQLLHTGLLTLAGVAAGFLVSHAALLLMGAPVPGGWFVLAVTVLTLAFASAAALVPAIVASRRDPATELRVP